MTEKSTATVRPNTDKYLKAKTAAGRPSLNNGDVVAQTLQGATLDEVYRLAANIIGDTQKALKAKYEHLNDGMQRMNLGNRMRGLVNKANNEEPGSGDTMIVNAGAFIREAVHERNEKAAAAKEAAKAAKAAAKPAKAKGGKRKAKKTAPKKAA